MKIPLLSAVALVMLVFSVGLVDAASLGNLTLNLTNQTEVNQVANLTVSFTLPNAFNYTNLSVGLPAGFGFVGSQIFNSTSISGCTSRGGFAGGQVNGNAVSLIIDCNASNFTGANTTFITVNVTNVILSILASNVTNGLLVEARYTPDPSDTFRDSATTSFTTTAANIFNVTIGVSGIFNGSRFVNISGNTFNVSAFGRDQYGNINTTGGFNFAANNTAILSYVSGNGTVIFDPTVGSIGTGVFNAIKNGTAFVNVSSVRSGVWNSTGLNLTVTANVIVGVNVSNYPSVSNSSVSASVNGTFNLTAFGYDLNGNMNITGGFNFYSSNLSVANYASGNATQYGVFNTSIQTGTATLTVLAALNSSASNTTTANATVHPAITSISSGSLTTAGAAIAWSTQETANTTIEYGTTDSFGSNATSSTLVSSHSATLSGLTAGTKYYYRAHSCSAFGLCSFSSTGTFTTTAISSSSGGSSGGSPSNVVSPVANGTANDSTINDSILGIFKDPAGIIGSGGSFLNISMPGNHSAAINVTGIFAPLQLPALGGLDLSFMSAFIAIIILLLLILAAKYKHMF